MFNPRISGRQDKDIGVAYTIFYLQVLLSIVYANCTKQKLFCRVSVSSQRFSQINEKVLMTFWLKVFTAWSVQIRSFFLVRVFPHLDWIRRDSISSYSVRMRKNTDQKKVRIWTLFTRWLTVFLCRVLRIFQLLRLHFHINLSQTSSPSRSYCRSISKLTSSRWKFYLHVKPYLSPRKMSVFSLLWLSHFQLWTNFEGKISLSWY